MKINKIILLSCLFLLVNGRLLAAPKLFIPEGKEYNLGELEEGVIYERSFFVTNIGDELLEIKSVSVSCGCTKIVSPRRAVSLLPKSSLKIEFTFNTEGMEGEVYRYIHIETNDVNNPAEKFKIYTNVRRSHFAAIKRFLSFGVLTVISAGLIDGINPCAFTVIVFFISFLTFVGYKKKELVILGSSFILAVFIAYVLIGLGLFKFIQSLEIFTAFSIIVYHTIAFLSFSLGVLSIYDYYIYKKTASTQNIKLKLPEFIKKKIQKIVQDAARNKNKAMVDLTLAIFFSGFLVSILESICTGQVYVPTIAYVLKVPDLRVKALTYLLLYNLMFVLPLVGVFLCALLGGTSERFSKAGRKYLGDIKLLMAFLFFMLGALILFVKK